jgi:alpha-galactosidase
MIESPFASLTIDPAQGCWSVFPAASSSPAIEGARMRVDYRCGRQQHSALQRWPERQVEPLHSTRSQHGSLPKVQVQFAPDACGLRSAIEFALPEDSPALFWRLSIENTGHQPVYLDRLTMLQVGPIYSEGRSQIQGIRPGDASFFTNGWQSWSYAGAYAPQDRFRRTRLGPIRAPTDFNAGTPQPNRRGHFSSDMFAVLGDRSTRRALLAGFLSQQQHFGSVEARLRLSDLSLSLWANGDGARLDPGARIETDWACLYWLDIDSPDPFGPYLEAVRQQAGLAAAPKTKIPTGWCSWYQFSSETTYQGAMTAQDIRDNLAALAHLKDDLPLSIVQIDDGFEAQIGDWLAFSSGFPQGVAPLAAEIRQAGFTPGLWLAPFIVHPRSRLAAEQPDWLLRGRFNRPVNAGLLWDAFTTALDLTHPQALDHTRQVVHTAVQEWGYPYLKLDFLYAAALPGKYHDPTRSRAQVLHSGLAALRQAAGQGAYLLGCGCPLGPAIGLVDAMRVSADTARRWKPSYRGVEAFIAAEPNFPSARNACHNSLARSPLHRRWWVNDPDCLLARPGTSLTLAEVQTVATVIALTGGSVFVSDHLPALPEERLRILRALLPPIGGRPRLLDWLDATTPRRIRLDLDAAAGPWHLLALFNWEDAPQDMTVLPGEFGLDPQGSYWGRESWRGEVRLLSETGWTFPACPPHSAVLLAVRQQTPDRPQYLGGDLHISQGLEVESWRWEPASGDLAFWLKRPGYAQGVIDLAFSGAIQAASLNGEALGWQRLTGGVYRLRTTFEKTADIRVRLLKHAQDHVG